MGQRSTNPRMLKFYDHYIFTLRYINHEKIYFVIYIRLDVISCFDFQTECDINAEIENRKSYCIANGLTFQPTPLFVGPLNCIERCFIIIDETRYEVDSVLKTFERTFHTFYALNAEYPRESSHIWQFLQITCLKINMDKVGINLNTLLGSLKY